MLILSAKQESQEVERREMDRSFWRSRYGPRDASCVRVADDNSPYVSRACWKLARSLSWEIGKCPSSQWCYCSSFSSSLACPPPPESSSSFVFMCISLMIYSRQRRLTFDCCVCRSKCQYPQPCPMTSLRNHKEVLIVGFSSLQQKYTYYIPQG